MPSPLCQVFNLMSLRLLQKSEYLTLAKMHPANCSSPQIYLTLKNLQILCFYASKPKFSYVATYFESFSPFFFPTGKKELLQQQAFSNTAQSTRTRRSQICKFSQTVFYKLTRAVQIFIDFVMCLSSPTDDAK